MNIYTERRIRSINQGLNEIGRCCEVHAHTLPIIPTLTKVNTNILPGLAV